ncbi:hypothetical protein ABCS02_24435 [Microbacterium sp. X-17]|uniref:hypothetical protein n=1 Tax=Microbacterium sp. X-17 TaxID=3144404 RepID=UPI0031F53842
MAGNEHHTPEHIPLPGEPSVPELEEDETIAPRPEEAIADALRATPDTEPHVRLSVTSPPHTGGMSETQGSGHWFHRTSEKIQRWLSEEPKAALDAEALDSVVGAGGIPVRDDTTGDFRLGPEDQEYIRELRQSRHDEDEIR